MPILQVPAFRKPTSLLPAFEEQTFLELTLTTANLTAARLQGADRTDSRLRNADFIDTKLDGEVLDTAHLLSGIVSTLLFLGMILPLMTSAKATSLALT